MNSISVLVELSQVKVYINRKLHLLLRRKGLIGIQSFKDCDPSFRIEYYFQDGTVVTTEYDKLETWESILRELDNIKGLF